MWKMGSALDVAVIAGAYQTERGVGYPRMTFIPP